MPIGFILFTGLSLEGPPLDVARALVKAYTGIIKKVDSEGSNALHFASHYGGSVEMIVLLSEIYAKAIRVQDKYGRSALYHTVDKCATIDVLKLLAAADPRMITAPCRPKNYLQLEKEGKEWDHLTPLYPAWLNFLTDKRSVETCTGKIWEKACLLARLAYCDYQGLPLDTQVFLMTTLIALDHMVPEELATVAIKGIPSRHLLRKDPSTSKNALSVVASSRHLSVERADEFIKLLIDAYPRAAKTLDKEGQTTVANAAESGKLRDSGLKRLFWAFPDEFFLSD